MKFGRCVMWRTSFCLLVSFLVWLFSKQIRGQWPAPVKLWRDNRIEWKNKTIEISCNNRKCIMNWSSYCVHLILCYFIFQMIVHLYRAISRFYCAVMTFSHTYAYVSFLWKRRIINKKFNVNFRRSAVKMNQFYWIRVSILNWTCVPCVHLQIKNNIN